MPVFVELEEPPPSSTKLLIDVEVPLVIPVLEPDVVEELAPCPLSVDKGDTPVVDALSTAVITKTLDEVEVRPPTRLEVNAVED